ncbi:nicotinate (nicotinamide) nucleotide adenylyltransferase [Campylobacter sp. MIT 99-7217]|uniref:nicotinate (nicotinamide) nucleotide adenylyltransferase n=1 Tax=Campylobacter sp. MIT 99-7217 TaxID=535091 RepID=UPI00115C1B9F|nr:nicotinate (nicotinamide) nucleotide adenylyltransferase [Campylobacter sp. MIT 99-7217]TQR33673.1 nicotinate (nicotinamide) nucleotide adenylyltransferase [Campylobacter sp. MIT 99-7217]
MKIAIFGGSFDPPHKGHDRIVKEALKCLDIDKLFIIPAFISPFKKGFFADETQRLKWVKKLWGNLEKVEISDFEIAQKRPVPSIESVEYLYKLYKPSKFYLLIGADHLKSLHLWHDFEKLSSLVEFVIANRDDIEIPKTFKDLNTHVNIASSFIRSTLDTNEVCDEIKDEVKDYYQKLQKTDTIS